MYFITGVDDVSSECDLDGYDGWDWIICNDCETPVDESLTSIIACIQNVLKEK